MSVSWGGLAGAIVASLFIAIGVAAVAGALTARPRREPAPLWFGLFCLLYGVRLSVRSSLVQALTPWPEERFDYIDAFITYSILIPAGRFIETLVGRGRYQLVRRTWQAGCVYAVVAITGDLIAGRPFAMGWLNGPVVIGSILVQGPHVVTATLGARWTPEARALAATGALFTAVAIIETISQGELLGKAVDAEPIAMLLLSVSLGWFVLARARERTYAFVALSRELELAREIQASLLPREMPRLHGLLVTGTYLPMGAVAGDYYDVATLPDGRVVIIVADVSGHGVPAALVASMVKVAFMVETERYDRPGELLAGLNRALTGRFERAYVTACCVTIDISRNTLSYAAAGHPPPLLRRQEGRTERLEVGGIALTWLPAVEYETAQVTFAPGDRLLLFTDGLLEASRRGGTDYFGDAEFERIVASSSPADDLSATIVMAHRAWIGVEAPLSDDVTLVVVERVAEPARQVSV